MDDIIMRLSKSPYAPVKMSLDSEFSFMCHRGLECFTECCGKIDIFLTPYDIVRLKRRLRTSSEEFISRYTTVAELKETRLPLLMLRMADNGRCPFVTEDGCTIYTDRPVVCRYYPIGFGLMKSNHIGEGDFFFPIKESFCLGYREEKRWTVRQWRLSQEINIYDDVNKFWFDIILSKKAMAPKLVPDEKSQRLFLLCSYDIDSFRRFVFESRFLKAYVVDTDTIKKIKEDEVELLKFGHRWLRGVLFGNPEYPKREQG